MFRVLLPALLLTTPALAQHEGHAPTAAAKPKAERKICKRENNTSSRYGAKKICLTAADWKVRERNASGSYEDRRNDTRERDD